MLKQRRDPEAYPEITEIGQMFSAIALYRDWSFGINSPAREAGAIDGRATSLDEDAGNLTTVLNHLMTQPLIKDRLLKYLQRFYPSASDLRFEIQGQTLVARVEEWNRFSTTTSRLSDGTLRWLCLLAILLNPSPPPLICIEEPELGLHPDALHGLAGMLKAASERTQLIVTTHSDFLINGFTDDPEAVVVCDKKRGATSLKRLAKDDLKVWLDDYSSLGELWTKGELGGTRF